MDSMNVAVPMPRRKSNKPMVINRIENREASSLSSICKNLMQKYDLSI
jgi:hypothetical protein